MSVVYVVYYMVKALNTIVYLSFQWSEYSQVKYTTFTAATHSVSSVALQELALMLETPQRDKPCARNLLKKYNVCNIYFESFY